MIIHYSNCIETWEKILFWFPVPVVLIVSISGFLIFSQEKDLSWKDDKKGVLLLELLGPLHPLVTSKYMRPQAIKYRWWFVCSVILLVVWFLGTNYLSICTLDT